KLAVCDDPYCTNANLQVVDSAGNVGVNNDLTLDNNGRPVISYYDATNQQLKLAQCNNLNCTAPNLTVVDNIDNPGI
ncbi:MAG: hypothetical protein GWN30_20345, partial [Gammaproteobacteria bacterium]|nr:hypothetical protein [Phycisphaerae bacterium]NIW47008.1 hypothetical protein [Gammaproteobacteria bacterium]